VGDVIVKLPVKSAHLARARALPLYFDSGSPTTFVRQDVADVLGHALPLADPEVFHGLGNGRFTARAAIRLLVRIRGVWCTFMAFVVSRDAMNDGVLIGHDFMQKFNIRLDPRRRTIVVDVEDLRRGQRAH
jgi:hypothetical protein